MSLLYTFPGELLKASIKKRPSKSIKSPYVADIVVDDEECLGHCPSLGLSGLLNGGANALVMKKNGNTKTQYSVEYVIVSEKQNNLNINYNIGSNPNIANKMVAYMLSNNLLPGFPTLNLDIAIVKPEYKVGNSRIDVFVSCESKKYYIEVKTVPIAFYHNLEDRKKAMDNTNKKYNEKIAIFPDGYRKSKNEPMSPRALKHVDELVTVKEEDPENSEVYMVYVVPRTDCKYFAPSKLDKFYYEKLKWAYDEKGLNIIAFDTRLDSEMGKIYFNKSLKIIF